MCARKSLKSDDWNNNTITGIAEWTVPKGGLFFWVKINEFDDIYDLIMKKCIPEGYFALPGNVFDPDNSKPCSYIRLCYSEATPENIEKV